jgi:hypothetical protein
MVSRCPIYSHITGQRGNIMSGNLTEKQFIALGRFTLSEVIAYSQWIELFYYAKMVNKEFIKNVSEYCNELNDCLPLLPTYFTETLPYLRKSRQFLIFLNQRKKGKEAGAPQLDTLFAENLDNINQFFTKFNLPTTEELSTKSPSSSNEVVRPLHERIVNPDLDESKSYQKAIRDMATSANSTKESCIEWKQLADNLKQDYETLDTKPSNYEIATSELFLQGVNNLFNREREYHLSQQKALELSNAKESPQTTKKKKMDTLQYQLSENIIVDEKRNR